MNRNAGNAVYRLPQSVALRLWRRTCVGAPHRRRAQAVDGRAGIRRDVNSLPIHARTEYCRHYGLRRVEPARVGWGDHRGRRVHSDTLDDWFVARGSIPSVCSRCASSEHPRRAFRRRRIADRPVRAPVTPSGLKPASHLAPAVLLRQLARVAWSMTVMHLPFAVV